MKKILSILITLLVLAGCSSASLKPSHNEILFKINGKEIREDDVFESMHLSNNSFQIVRSEAQKILLNYLVDEDDDFNKQVQERLEEAKTTLGDNFDLFLKENGFENEEEYIDTIVKDIVRLDIALTQVMDDDYENIKSKRPRQVKIIEVEADSANKALELAKSGSSLEEVYEEYGVENTQYKGNVILVSENSNLDTAPLDKLLNATDNGLIKEVVTSSSTNAQYILEVVNIDADELKDEVIEEFINDSELSEQYLAKLFSKHKFKLYDQHLYDAFNENLPEYIK